MGSDLLSSREHLLMFQLDAAGGSYRATDHVSSGGEAGEGDLLCYGAPGRCLAEALSHVLATAKDGQGGGHS